MDLQSAEIWRSLLAQAAEVCASELRIMEVCGTHTNAIAQNNLRSLLPENVQLISGPGCPVCVSGVLFIEKIRSLLRSNITVAMFGDLLRIPGSQGTLMGEKNLKVVYSPEDALEYARQNPEQEVVFAAVGFAPTLSAAAALIMECRACGVENFSLLSDFKELLPVLRMLCAQRGLHGLLLPGHVASITGKNYFRNLPVPGVVAGFEPENILHSLQIILQAVAGSQLDWLVNNYPSAVRENGNTAALKLIEAVFEVSNSVWRGLGEVPGGGWKLRNEYAQFDAEKRYDLTGVQASENPACRCGEVLTGKISPRGCPLFGKVCTPRNPAGACMSSSEGSCAAEFNYAGGSDL